MPDQPGPRRDAPVRRGRLGEDLAARHLEAAGFAIVARNWRSPRGEIDLICTDGPTVVFVEVRSRRSRRLGRPEASVDWNKRRTVVLASQLWLQRNGGVERPIRYDVIAVEHGEPAPRIRHLRGAFDGSGDAL